MVDNGCNIWNGDAYKNYLHKVIRDKDIVRYLKSYSRDENDVPTIELYSQEEFINKIKTDDKFAEKWGSLGKIYGYQWRSWGERNHDSISNEYFIGIDQIQNLINDLKTNPDSRRLMVNAWNVGELDQMVLPPCHYGFQVYTRELSFDEFWDRLTPKQRGTMEKPYEGETYNGIDSRIEFKNIASEVHNLPTRAISLMWNQRSVDTGLGWSFNIASYSLLLIMLAKQVNMIPDEIICNLGDVHLYSNHIEPIKEQLGREPFPLPNVTLSDRIVNDISEYTLEDIRLENYQSHPTIKLPLSN